MKNILLLFIYTFSINSFIVAQNSFFKKINYKDGYHTIIRDFIEDDNNNIYTIDTRFDDSKEMFYPAIATFSKYSEQGIFIDSISFTKTIHQYLLGFIQLSSGNFLAIVQEKEQENDSALLSLVEISPDLEVVEKTTISTIHNIFVDNDFIQLQNGDILFCSSVPHAPNYLQGAHTDLQFYVFDLNKTLKFEKKYQINGSNGDGLPFSLKDVHEDQNNDLLMSSFCFTDTNSFDDLNHIVIFESENLEVTDTICISELDYYSGMWRNEGLAISNNRYFIGGNYSEWNTNYEGFGITKTNTNFEIEDQISFGGDSDTTYRWNSAYRHMINYKDGMLFYASMIRHKTIQMQLIEVFKFNETLEVLWHKIIGIENEYFDVVTIKGTNDGGCIVVGDVKSTSGATTEGFILKLDSNGTLTNTDEKSIKVVNALVYPNPGKDQLNLKSTITNATFQLTDMEGKRLIQQNITQENMTFDTQKLPAGTYLWTLTQEGKVVERGKWVRD